MQTESVLRYSLLELSAIERYNNGENIISDSQKALFESIVQRIVNVYTSQNIINEEFIAEQFGVENFDDQRILQALLYFEAGKRVAVKQDLTLKDIAKLYDEVYGTFFYGFELSYEVVSSFIDQLHDNFETEVLLKTRCFHTSGEKFIKEINEIYQDGYTQEDVLSKMNMYNDGAYTELPLAVDALCYICNLHGYYDLWYRLFDVLKYFPLQGSMLGQIHRVEGYIELLKRHVGQNDYKVVCSLVLDRFLPLLTDIPERLQRNSLSELLQDDDRQYCKYLMDEWNKQYNDVVSVVTELLVDGLGVQLLSSWYGREQRRVQGMQAKFAENPKHALEVMRGVMDTHAAKDVHDLENCSFDTLLYYASVADTSNREYSSILIEEICKQAYSAKWIPTHQLTDEGFERLRELYKLLDVSGFDGLILMQRYRMPTEGYAYDSKSSLNTYNGDNFWLPIPVLQNEACFDKRNFDRILSFLFNVINDSSTAIHDYYFTAFYFAELIVTQIAPEMKDDFEKALICNVSNLIFVLRVLSANEGVISKDVKAVLSNRVENEWQYEKKLFRSRDKQQIAFLEEYLNRL